MAHSVNLDRIKDMSKVRVLILDWHQVVDRGEEGNTYSLGKVTLSRLKFINRCIELPIAATPWNSIIHRFSQDS